MSISKNVGGLAKHLNDIRTDRKYLDVKNDISSALSKIPRVGGKVKKVVEKMKENIKYVLVPGGIFNEFGFKYVGTIDGHNFDELIKVFNNAKQIDGPVLLHIHTKKGKGYEYAEQAPGNYHGVDSFDIETGKPQKAKKNLSYSEVFGDAMVKLAEKYPKLVAITAAMQQGTGLDKFEAKFHERFFDVGIAEAHAVTFAAGLAAAGYKPVFSVYSSFLQRAYDEVVHDIGIQNLPVVFAIDRAGIVGADGETHQGLFDISFLSHIPNIAIMAPKNKYELEDMLEFAMKYDAPIAIRYPRGEAFAGLSEFRTPIEYGKAEIIQNGQNIAIIALGDMVATANATVRILEEKGLKPMFINARFASPIDHELLKEIAHTFKYIFTIENNIASGGFGSKVLEKLSESQISNIMVHRFAFPDKFIEQGKCN
jgi:1-deoxy-D-xylulose-5-phosphate synthase